MLWPIELPMKLTFWILASMVVITTLIAIVKRWRAQHVFVASAALAAVAFVPSCTGIMYVIDSNRFGNFQYASYAEVQDSRVYRYLPRSAHSITLEKTAMGHRAKYHLTEDEMLTFLDELWEKSGQEPPFARSEFGDGALANPDEIDYLFRGLGWAPLKSARQINSPVETNGGGARYFFDKESGTAYHSAAYW